MSTRAEIQAFGLRQDARDLESAVRVLRRRRVQPVGMSRAAYCRLLLATADEMRDEARTLDGDS